MGTKDPRVDAYIAKSAEFARPILGYLREVIHDTCPTVEEATKWGMPYFSYHGMLCGMAAFKAHASFGFWKGPLVTPDRPSEDAMGSFGRLTSTKDLPPRRQLEGYSRTAMKLNEDDVKPERHKRAALELPADLAAALAKNRKAKAVFEAFSPSAKREYIEWITEAKREATRASRLQQAIEWIAEGKQRNWKYMATK